MTLKTINTQFSVRSLIPDLPLVIWMISLAIILGIGGGLNTPEFISVFNTGWGYAIGEFALILLPSFVLAAALSGREIEAASKLAVVVSPAAGAGMVCPDTAYATLSPMAEKQRIPIAFGSFAGFKLLYPAGPLIVATGLDVADPFIMVFGFILLVPIWAVGIWWGKLQSNSNSISSVKPTSHKGKGGGSIWIVVIPFMLLGFLLVSGFYLDLSAWPILDFVTNAKGALITVAILSLFSVAPGKRRDCLDSAISRTGSLLLIIGAASALGGVLTKAVPLGNLISPDTGIMGIIGLFVLTAIFKLVQGSSMATFASIGPIAAPIVAASNLSATSAVFAICLGSFFAILPNDSFYWLVRNNALNNSNHIRATIILAGGSTLQALTGLIVLIAFHLIGLV